jgi:hypothetical protein
MLGLINTLWMMGCVIGVGFWAGRSGGKNSGGEGRQGRGGIAIAMTIIGLLLVPLITGLNATPVIEWIGTLAGLGAGYLVARR